MKFDKSSDDCENLGDDLKSSLEFIGKSLDDERAIKMKLPFGGSLHIERALPFLCVYRFFPQRWDSGTRELIMAEASYLIASGAKAHHAYLTRLINLVVTKLSELFQGFLLVEIFADRNPTFIDDGATLKPQFRIITSSSRPPTNPSQILERSLRQLRIGKYLADVNTSSPFPVVKPEGAGILLSSVASERLNCFSIGLGIYPFYQKTENCGVFPLLIRNLRRKLAVSLRKCYYEFICEHTTYRPPNYQCLGKRVMTRETWRIDRSLTKINQKFEFLLLVTPINHNSAWNRFKSSHFEKAPVFYYRPLPIDPAILKRELYTVPLERVYDPAVALLFRRKREELDLKLTMLEGRGSSRFFHGSMQLYGKISDELLTLSTQILTLIAPRSHEKTSGKSLNADELVVQCQKELAYYKENYGSSWESKIEIRDDLSSIMVSSGNLLIGKRVKISPSRLKPLLQHEIGTHVLTYQNGLLQPFQLLSRGLAGYEELQEGLAVLAEYLVSGLSRPRLRILAGRVIAARALIDGAGFVDLFRELNQKYGFDQRTAFDITVRVFRGGGLTKDMIYLQGLVKCIEYIQKGGNLETLMVGKIGFDHISIVNELKWRRILNPPSFIPPYLKLPECLEKLNLIKEGLNILEIMKGKSRCRNGLGGPKRKS